MKINTLIQRHYNLHRRVTDAEVEAEIANIERLGTAFLDDNQHYLATKLSMALGRDFDTGLTLSERK